MKKGKKVLGMMIVSLLLIGSIVMVSAGFWGDLFTFGDDSELEGELEESKFDATVTLSNAPPRIVAFRPTVDTPRVATNPGEVEPLAGTNAFAAIVFIVEDPNSDDLPGIGGGGSVVTGPVSGTGNVYVTLTSPVNAPVLGNAVSRPASVCIAAECASGTNPNCDATTDNVDGTNYLNQVQYTCYVSLEYYDEQAPGDVNNGAELGANLWTITAEIKDKGGSTDVSSSGEIGFDGVGCSGLGDCDYMEYGKVTAIDTAAAEVSWIGLSVSATDTAADGPLVLDNFGNTAVTAIDVRGQDLTGTNIPSATMAVAAFSVGNSLGGVNLGSCDIANSANANELIGSSFVTAPGVGVPYSAFGIDTENAFFCVWDAVDPNHLTGGIDSSYSATILKINNWEVQFTE